MSLAWSLLLAACSSEPVPAGTAGTGQSISRAASHVIEQEAIRDCMAQQGFEYDPVDFLEEPLPETFSNQFFLDYAELDTVGYRSLYRVLARNFGSTGAPRRPTLEESSAWTSAQRTAHFEMIQQYAIALSGEEFIETLENETDTRALLSGCRGEGLDAVEDVSIIDPVPAWVEGDRLVDASQRLEATDDYAQFFDNWQGCMAEAGYQLTTASYRPIFIDLRREFDEQLAQLGRSDPARIEELAAAADPGSQALSIEWFVGVVETDPLLFEMYEREIGQASKDASCRAQSEGLLRDSIAAIERELGIS